MGDGGGGAGSGAGKSNSLIYVSPLIQSDTDEESDATAHDASRNASYSSRYSNLSLNSNISNTSFNGNDSGVRGRFDQLDNGNGSGTTNGDYETSTNFTKRLLSFRSQNIAPASVSTQPTVSMLDSSKCHVIGGGGDGQCLC